MTRKPSTTRIKKSETVSLDPQKQFNGSADMLSKLRLDVKCKTENQKKLINLIKEKEIVICAGLAGTGKTFLTCFQALDLLKKYPETYKKIVLIKSVTTLKSEEIGFLKGTLEEKMEPFIYSFVNNFEKIIGKVQTELLRKEHIIETLPIAYLRGINIDNSLVVIDEVQNISIENIRTILTRIGYNSKMIFLGDVKQIDSKNKKDSALRFLLDKFSHIDEIGTIELGTEDVVRNPLIKKIEEVFDNLEENKKL